MIEVRRASDRFVTRTEWSESRHSFSFGMHYDPTNVGHGLLVAHNQDTLGIGSGYARHPHRDMEIVTWVLQGSLVHEDSTGRSGAVLPGQLQTMSAGSGVMHFEGSDAEGLPGGEPPVPVRFIQMWVVPDRPGGPPSYQQAEVDSALAGGALVPVASGRRQHSRSAVPIGNRNAALHVGRLRPGDRVTLPEAPYLHLFVAQGTVRLEGAGCLLEGDAARFTATGGQEVSTAQGGEILVWEMHARVGGP